MNNKYKQAYQKQKHIQQISYSSSNSNTKPSNKHLGPI